MYEYPADYVSPDPKPVEYEEGRGSGYDGKPTGLRNPPRLNTNVVTVTGGDTGARDTVNGPQSATGQQSAGLGQLLLVGLGLWFLFGGKK